MVPLAERLSSPPMPLFPTEWGRERLEETVGDPSLQVQHPFPVSGAAFPSTPRLALLQAWEGLTHLGFFPSLPLLVRSPVLSQPLFVLLRVLFHQLTYFSLNLCFICLFVCFLVNLFPLN